MSIHIAHRGPDQEGAFEAPEVSLAARRLAIIDLAGGHQPKCSEDGTVQVVFNGEIYNHAAIAQKLRAAGHLLASHSDTEMIAHLYEEEGPALLTRLRGMFALALWDARRHQLLLARDRMGEKPLHYALARGRLVFASEIKAVAAAGLTTSDLDFVALDEFLTLGYTTGHDTLLSGIKKLPAAHRLLWRRGSIDVAPYWRLPQVVADSATPAVSPQRAAIEIRASIEDAVRLQSVADVPVGCFLSGGLDSSLVTALMARHADRRVRTFCVGIEGDTTGDERSGARDIARFLGTDHHDLVVGAPTGTDLVDLATVLDAPPSNPASWPTYRLAALAAESVKVVLVGEGADELFGGYGKYVYPFAMQVAGALGRPLAKAIARMLPWTPDRFTSLRRLARALDCAGPCEAFEDVNAVFRRSDRTRLLLCPEAQPPPADAARPWMRNAQAAQGDVLEHMTRFDLTGYLPEDNLVRLDRTTMAHGIEGRAPYLDHLLVERLLSAGAPARIGLPSTKSMLRQVASPFLPASVLRKRKRAFEMPLQSWLRGPLAPVVDAVTAPRFLLRQGIFAPAEVQRLVVRQRIGDPTANRPLWVLMAFQIWHSTTVADRSLSSSVLTRLLDETSRPAIRPEVAA